MAEVGTPGRMPVVLIVGNWSSGTTAVTGYLARLGGFACPPTIQTNDPRTPNSFESAAFRNAVSAVHHEITLEKIGEASDFSAWFAPWLREQEAPARMNGRHFLLLKHPLSAFLIKEINDICQPRIVVVTRPYSKIESTRKRRGWAPNYGEAGANIIYSRAFVTMIEEGLPFFSLDFEAFRERKSLRNDLVEYCRASALPQAMERAEAWIR